MREKRSSNRGKAGLIAVALVCLCAFFLFVTDFLTEEQAHVSPDYGREDLEPTLSKAQIRGAVARLKNESQEREDTPDYLFTQEEYDLIYHQTGLGKEAVDKVMERDDGEQFLKDMQEIFFTEPSYICIRDNWISSREQTTDEEGNIARSIELTGLEDGDIIVTKSSHVYGWRNGHAALVVDAENKKTLEAIVIGKNTGIRRFKKWEKYPNVLVLRLVGADAEKRREIAKWAQENLMDIPYELTVGFFGTKGEVLDSAAALSPSSTAGPALSTENAGDNEEQAAEAIAGTQCAHLIWRAYAQFGYDLDPDGGWLVTPRQIANSPLLEVVQVYGMDPDDPWPY